MYYPDIFLEGLKRTTDSVSQDIRRPDPDSNRASPESEPRAVSLYQPVRLHVITERINVYIFISLYTFLFWNLYIIKQTYKYGIQLGVETIVYIGY
jgi:hypothetical protein